MKYLRLMSLMTLLGASSLALADTPVPDKGDTTWMMISTILVILMILRFGFILWRFSTR